MIHCASASVQLLSSSSLPPSCLLPPPSSLPSFYPPSYTDYSSSSGSSRGVTSGGSSRSFGKHSAFADSAGSEPKPSSKVSSFGSFQSGGSDSSRASRSSKWVCGTQAFLCNRNCFISILLYIWPLFYLYSIVSVMYCNLLIRDTLWDIKFTVEPR